jgi:hypothetical protein
MNLSPEAFEQVLTELADRADGHQVVDRVPSVRGRARRNARRRAGAMAAALAVVIVLVSGVAGFGGLPILRGGGPGPAHELPPRPYLTVQLVRDEKKEAMTTPRQAGGRVVWVNVILHGRVPRRTGYQTGADVKQNLWELKLTADRGNYTVTVRPLQEVQCNADAPLVDIDTSIPMQLEYDPGNYIPMLGSHDLTFTTGACMPVGLIRKTLTVMVK